MSKPLFEFVKVAAGDRFPYETGTFYTHFDDTTKKFWMSRIDKGSVQHKDIYILRPAESPEAGKPDSDALFAASVSMQTLNKITNTPDAGREGNRDELAKIEAAPYHETAAAREMAFKNGWDACLRQKQNSFLPVLEENYLAATRASDSEIDEIFSAKNKRDAVIETYKDLIAIYKSPTPADPGSQVEAVDFTEWWINEGWQIRKNGTFIQIGASGTPMLGRPDDRIKSVNELFTLYKQSL